MDNCIQALSSMNHNISTAGLLAWSAQKPLFSIARDTWIGEIDQHNQSRFESVFDTLHKISHGKRFRSQADGR